MVVGSILVFLVAALMVGVMLVVHRLVPAVRREPHNDVVGFVYAVVGVIYAVILAMVVIAVWEGMENARANTYGEANAVVQIAWYAHSLPQPAHDRLLTLTREYSETVATREWPLLAKHQRSKQAGALVDQIRELLLAQQPGTLADQARYDQALTAATDLSTTRGQRVYQASEGVPLMLWVALALGGLVTVGFAIMFGMSSLVAHGTVVFSVSLLLGYMLLLVYALNSPFGGIVHVDPKAFELAVQRMSTIT